MRGKGRRLVTNYKRTQCDGLVGACLNAGAALFAQVPVHADYGLSSPGMREQSARLVGGIERSGRARLNAQQATGAFLLVHDDAEVALGASGGFLGRASVIVLSSCRHWTSLSYAGRV